MTDDNRQFYELPPLGLYVHIPWCIKKCPYCDFNSHEQRDPLPEDDYVDALLSDLADEIPLVWGRQISSVFIGGGTPSLFSARALDRLISGIRALTALAPNVELTLEANPGTFEQERFKDYRALGINRLSIGVQSFDDRMLSALGRVHTAQETFGAVEIAQSAGFEKINLDLMFGLPEQTIRDCSKDIEHALNLGTTHLSCYELTLEPNTLFARFPPTLPEDDLRCEMQDVIVQSLSHAGFERYEVSAYARETTNNAHRSEHNMNYWLFGDYIGIGAGAHGKISSAQNGTIVRRWKQRHPRTYLLAPSSEQRLGGQTTVTIEDTALEFMMNALRLKAGFPIPLFQKHTGLALDRWQSIIDTAMTQELLEQHTLNLRATEKGYRLLNDLLALFLPDTSDAIVENADTVKRYTTIALNVER